MPYKIDEQRSRFHSYETLWKKKGLELLLKHCGAAEKTSILDYGCGRGEFISMAAEAGYQVRGCDIDPVCVELASHYGRAVLLEDGSLSQQFGIKSFDVVASFHVLEHMENPKKTLLEFAQISKKYILIAVPNLARFPRLRWGRVSYSNTGHLQGWDHSTLLNLAENHCGLRWVEWAFDTTVLGSISHYAGKIIGDKGLRKLEAGFFNRKWPHLSSSIIGLFEVAG